MVLLALLCVASSSATGFESRLIADVSDVEVEFGLVINHANTIQRENSLVPPPGNYSRGTFIVAMFHSLEAVGAYEIYSTNSTGNIPLKLRNQNQGMCLNRWTTTDFVHYFGGECTLWVPSDGLEQWRGLG